MAKVEDRDYGYKKIVLNIKELNGKGVKVGLMGDEEYEGVSVVDYAMYNEFGTAHIPARPFMQTTFDRYRADVMKFTEHLVNGIIEGQYTADHVMRVLGEWYQAKVQLTIRDAKNWAVPNTPETIKRKGSSSPLIDTGRMVGAVRYEVFG